MKTIGLSIILAAAAGAQQFASSSWNVKEGEATAVFGPPRGAPVVTGAPYSAGQVQEYVAPDGRSEARSNVIGHFARDAQGRTRIERAYKPAPVWVTEIFDPVVGVAYLLDGQEKIAHRMALPPAPSATPTTPGGPGTTVEKLGSQAIEGVVAEGTRLTFGGNGRPVMSVENWESPELKVTLVTKSSNGYTTSLTPLSRTEPEPSLFQPPPGYRVVDEASPFSMTMRFR